MCRIYAIKLIYFTSSFTLCRSLCDTKQIGKLNSEQFALAMWLINQKVQGVDPPASLTPEMVPPSLRAKAPAEGIVVSLFQCLIVREYCSKVNKHFQVLEMSLYLIWKLEKRLFLLFTMKAYNFNIIIMQIYNSEDMCRVGTTNKVSYFVPVWKWLTCSFLVYQLGFIVMTIIWDFLTSYLIIIL